MGWLAAEVWTRTMLNVLFAVAEKSEQSLADLPYLETPLRTRFHLSDSVIFALHHGLVLDL